MSNWELACLIWDTTAHALSALALFCIPLILVAIAKVRRRSGKGCREVIIADYTFAAFILSCSFGHALDAVHWGGLLRTIVASSTAMLSWFAIFHLPALLYPNLKGLVDE